MCTSMHLANLWLHGSILIIIRGTEPLSILVLEARKCNLFSMHCTFRPLMAFLCRPDPCCRLCSSWRST